MTPAGATTDDEQAGQFVRHDLPRDPARDPIRQSVAPDTESAFSRLPRNVASGRRWR